MNTESIALNKLSAWKGNVRKTDVAEELDSLVASIRAHGILVPLIVQKGDKGERKVVAGQRRLLALRALQKEGNLPADHAVPCVIADKDADAAEISLIENAVRTQMHPADQFEAFRDLIDKGSSVADVAARFGISETAVTKLMKLGRVSPKILAAYRNGDMNMEAVQAFTLTDDHTVQETYWKEAKGWQKSAHSIREALTNGEVKATDKRIGFIGGIDAYEAAGGKVRRDLFDDRNAGYISDLSLLNKLVVAKLEETATALRAEGWKWVEIMPDFDWSATRDHRQVRSERAPLTPEQEARLVELGEQQDSLAAIAEEDELTDEQETTLEAIQEEIDSLQERQQVFRSEDIARAGAFVSIDYNGKADIRRGWVKPEDQDATETDASGTAAAKEKNFADESGIPAALIEDITAQRTAAMRIELATNPSVALAATVYTLACSALSFGKNYSCLKLSVQPVWLDPMIKHPGQSAALEASKSDNALIARLPREHTALWQHCLDSSIAELVALLAIFVSQGVDAVNYKNGSKACAHADQLAAALHLDMKEHFKPTAETYFSRLPKAEIIKALVEMDGAQVSLTTEKLKKGALAEFAERTFETTGKTWLPEPLRSISAETEPSEERDAA